MMERKIIKTLAGIELSVSRVYAMAAASEVVFLVTLQVPKYGSVLGARRSEGFLRGAKIHHLFPTASGQVAVFVATLKTEYFVVFVQTHADAIT